MITQEIVVGMVLIILGGFSAVRPDLILSYKRWFSKKVYGAEFAPSQRTATIQRVLGAVFIVIGLILVL